MKRGGLFCVFLLIVMTTYSQQDPHFSQYMYNLSYFNPGYVGSTDMICMSLANRQQWVGFTGAPNTSFFQANAPVKPFGINSGVGLSLLSDNVAFDKNLSITGYYAYRLDVGPGTLGIGVNLGLINKALEADWQIPTELGSDFVSAESDPAIPDADESRMTFDMGLGVYYTTGNLYFGLSSTHVNRPKIKYVDKRESYIGRHYYLLSGYRWQLSNPMFEVMPSVLLKTDGRTNQFDASALVRYNKKFWAGVSLRAGDALIGIIGFELFNGVRIGYSYDFTTSDIGNYSSGSHEFTVGYCFSLSMDKTPQKYKSIRFL
ncbi:MAG: type IX secretion system membrane protein PorP/SprF [Bacteroidales bacterium]|nr:type IX secretion system membrane protein PorP/SprF [Bacteroidales bacterium]